MTRLYGRSLRGQRLIDKTPHGHWQTTTVIGAVDTDGMRCSQVIEGGVNGKLFLKFVKEVLVPTLRKGDVVVMDNLGSHKVKGVREAIEAAGAEVLYLPPYSPDLNPIEMIFSKLKSGLRKLACRTREALWEAIPRILASVTKKQARKCFAHCGYAATVKLKVL